MSIPHVAPSFLPVAYPPLMKNWTVRFRDHMHLHKLSQDRLGEILGVSQGAIGHWLRRDREINLTDFLALCEAAGADPKTILFGANEPPLVSEIRQVLSAHPELIPSYHKFERGMRRKKPRRQKVRTHG